MMISAPLPTPSRRRRFACMVYEATLLFAVIFLASYAFDTLTHSTHALLYRHARQAWLFFVIGVYFVVCWKMSGQTLPMKTWRIQLHDQQGRPPSLGKLILRYLLLWPSILITIGLIAALSSLTDQPYIDLFSATAPLSLFIWSWFDPEGQFMHDRLLGTRLSDIRHSKT
jgi:uncharacterized RDD family membrane protein YckC